MGIDNSIVDSILVSVENSKSVNDFILKANVDNVHVSMYDLENIMRLNDIYKRKLINSFNRIYLRALLDVLPYKLDKEFSTMFGGHDPHRMYLKSKYVKELPNLSPILKMEKGSIFMEIFVSLGGVTLLVELLKATILEDVKVSWKNTKFSKSIRELLAEKTDSRMLEEIHRETKEEFLHEVTKTKYRRKFVVRLEGEDSVEINVLRDMGDHQLNSLMNHAGNLISKRKPLKK